MGETKALHYAEDMPWWFWILLWVALALAAALFYVLIGYRVFRKFMALVREGQSAAGGLVPAPAAGSENVPLRPTPLPGVFMDPETAKELYSEGKADRQADRRRRRVERRMRSHQPRAWRDLPDL